MQFGLENQHREFFNEHGWIEFESLLTPEQAAELNLQVENTLCQRLQMGPHKLNRLSPKGLYVEGRDLWRDSPEIKKFITHRRYAQMVSELAEEKPLRLAYDQALFSPRSMPGVVLPPEEVVELPSRGALNELSCLQGLVCGLIICLESDADASPTPPLPTRPGNALFLSPSHAINLQHLWEGSGRRYFLIAYGRAVTLFVHQLNDPHRDKVRQMGYEYGDRLTDRTHPVVYR